MIGIIGSPRERQVRYMVHLLRGLRAEVTVIDSESFPEGQEISFDLDRIVVDGGPPRRFRSLYVRNLFSSPIAVSDHVTRKLDEDWHGASVMLREKMALLRGFINIVERAGGRVANPNETVFTCDKPFQLQWLKANGVPVPDTLVSNSPAAVVEFCRRHARVIYKPVSGGATTREVEPEDLMPERLARLKSAPVIFQEYVPGDNVRVYVVGGQIAAAGLIRTGDDLDFRRAEGEVELIRLPDKVAEMCVTSARLCGLAFTGIDVKRDGDRWVLLECNQSPLFVGFDRKSGARVGPSLARYLAG
ncbi:MAG: ATP-grasp domain-containing protein [Planctomycetes bacterium]|nr:ATP-grasp domain-containing protein [Planctomycetota bacterium]